MIPSVRARQDADLPVLVHALRAVHERDGYPVRWHEPAADWLTPLGTVGAWVGLLEASPVAHAVLEEHETGLVVGRLFVGPAARGRGLAGLLLEAAESEARHRGQPLSLEVQVRATAAIALYERRGWRRTDTHQAGWTELDGTPAIAYRYAAPRS
jgi:GNAT superfamily N-acetyltransferase